MKAVLQNFKTGDMAVENVPPPALKPDGVLVRTAASLISAGTEKAVIELAKMNPLQKARARPDLVKKVLAKAGQEGLLATARIVQNLVSAPLPLGYSCAGHALQIGARVAGISPGQRVACAGLGYANHAEIVYVPRKLLVPIPAGVSFADAAFVTVGAIALQGVRQAALTLGETVVVIGLGLVGQITSQICRASGCRVIGVDLDERKVGLARRTGADHGIVAGRDDVKAAVMALTANRGADAVIIAAGTKSSDPVILAPELLRDRGRVVAVGDVGHEVPRRAYYEKEIQLLQSRSYGPGRYDPDYEEKGRDYPIGYVRWTENRNMEAFLDLVARGDVKLGPLLTHRFKIDDAESGYDLITRDSNEFTVGLLLEYPESKEPPASTVQLETKPQPAASDDITVGVIGAGQFAQGLLLPALKSVPGVRFRSFATGSGLTSVNVARKYGAPLCTSDHREILNDPAVNAVLIATRHDTHAAMVAETLAAGKHCFVEKPLALDEPGLARIIETRAKAPGILLVGYNRRFSPLASRLRDAVTGSKLIMNYRVNAGFIPASHWHQDTESGGGRIVGEVCHFVDTLQYLCGADPVSVHAASVCAGNAAADPDDLIVTLTFADGSIGTIAYTASGDPAFPKERLEVFGGGYAGVIDNWRSLRIQGHKKNIRERRWLQAEKGIRQEMAAFIDGARKGASPIPFNSLVLTSKTVFAIQRALREGGDVAVDEQQKE